MENRYIEWICHKGLSQEETDVAAWEVRTHHDWACGALHLYYGVGGVNTFGWRVAPVWHTAHSKWHDTLWLWLRQHIHTIATNLYGFLSLCVCTTKCNTMNAFEAAVRYYPPLFDWLLQDSRYSKGTELLWRDQEGSVMQPGGGW